MSTIIPSAACRLVPWGFQAILAGGDSGEGKELTPAEGGAGGGIEGKEASSQNEEGIVAAPCARGDSVHIYVIARIVERMVVIVPFEQASTSAAPRARGTQLNGIEVRTERQLQQMKMWRCATASLNCRSAVRAWYDRRSTSRIEDAEFGTARFNFNN